MPTPGAPMTSTLISESSDFLRRIPRIGDEFIVVRVVGVAPPNWRGLAAGQPDAVDADTARRWRRRQQRKRDWCAVCLDPSRCLTQSFSLSLLLEFRDESRVKKTWWCLKTATDAHRSPGASTRATPFRNRAIYQRNCYLLPPQNSISLELWMGITLKPIDFLTRYNMHF